MGRGQCCPTLPRRRTCSGSRSRTAPVRRSGRRAAEGRTRPRAIAAEPVACPAVPTGASVAQGRHASAAALRSVVASLYRCRLTRVPVDSGQSVGVRLCSSVTRRRAHYRVVLAARYAVHEDKDCCRAGRPAHEEAEEPTVDHVIAKAVACARTAARRGQSPRIRRPLFGTAARALRRSWPRPRTESPAPRKPELGRVSLLPPSESFL